MEDIKTSPKSLRSLVGEINKGKYNFDLPIQRRAGIWKPKEKSLFIDTLLRNYPIYPALVNKHSDTKEIDVVDFKQRFTTIAAFANDEFKLSKNLKPLTIDGTEYEIAGKKFSKLDEAVQSRFNDRDISIITMTDATEEEIVDIFERINMGHQLSNGQKRSTIESNEVREIIYSIADHPFFEKVLSPAQFKKNLDRDIVIQCLMLTEKTDKNNFTSFRDVDMNKFIIGTISNIDRPMNPAAKGSRSMNLYMSRVTEGMIRREREQILSADQKDIRALAKILKAVLDADQICVIGSEEKIEEQKEMFMEIRTLS